ncbi:MAG: lamin tail domain-containing protein, partial [Calditrichales bacterium]|nr:lamin tail domain-containing protein [Calditrichales bacterium]
ENGEYDDWIEIYNPGPEAVDVGGMYISDDNTNPTVWQIPTTAPDTTTIQPGGFLLLWADKETGQGVLHVNLKLSSGGEDVVLSAPNGTTMIDSYTYSAQTTDVSMGRNPDGSDNWVAFDTPTPGASNQ